jgi:hypothetical protein
VFTVPREATAQQAFTADYLGCEKLPSEITEINHEVKHLLKTSWEITGARWKSTLWKAPYLIRSTRFRCG